MTTTRTTTKADNEYMHEVPFGFFYTTKKKVIHNNGYAA
jgi:hypothetical protein